MYCVICLKYYRIVIYYVRKIKLKFKVGLCVCDGVFVFLLLNFFNV